MKIVNKWVEIEESPDGKSLTILFPITKAQITLTVIEAEELMIGLSRLLED